MDPATGTLTASTSRMHELFVDEWDKVYNRYEQGDSTHIPDPTVFLDTYADNIIQCHAEDCTLAPEDYYQPIQGMRTDSKRGLDGWTVRELQALPTDIWEVRSSTAECFLENSTLPESYRHVSAPMIPSGDAKTPKQHRYLTAFPVLYRVYAGALWNKLRSWQEPWIHPGCKGGRAQCDTTDVVWSVQGEVAFATLMGSTSTVATLDYDKLFDMLDPSFTARLLAVCGFPKQLARQWLSLYTRLIRYITVGGCYSSPFYDYQWNRPG